MFSCSTSRVGFTASTKVCITAPRSRHLIDLFKDFVDFQSRPSHLRCRVFHTFSSTISMGKKGKTEVGAEVWERIKKHPELIFVRDSF